LFEPKDLLFQAYPGKASRAKERRCTSRKEIDSFDTRTLAERNRLGIARLTPEKSDMTTENFSNVSLYSSRIAAELACTRPILPAKLALETKRYALWIKI
jgi:hypothetical protein